MKDYFLPDQRYFYIDSENCRSAKTKLYGYAITREGFVDEDNRRNADMTALDGCGVYVYVENTGKEIVIRQDFNGSYGLFLFREGSFFAVSNSYQYLADHLKATHPLTLNRDYANHMICSELVSLSHNGTMIKEIGLLPRNVVVRIDPEQSLLSTEEIDYREGSIELNSPEGIALLDDWYDRWTHLFRSVQSMTDNLTVALSGGFDSRITFMLALTSGIDMNRVTVYSIKDNLHTHSEDYEIAEQIAEHFGLRLNENHYTGDVVHFSLRDLINICFYGKISFHNEMYYKFTYGTRKRFVVPGAGGGVLRDFWNISPGEFGKKYVNIASQYKPALFLELRKSMLGILNSSFSFVRDKYGIDDANSPTVTQRVYIETRSRSHFGAAEVDDFHSNVMNLPPLLDPALRSFRSGDERCSDKRLLFAVIMTRYCPELLDFPIDSGRSYDPATLSYAREINAKYPRAAERTERPILPFAIDSLRKDESDENTRVPADRPNAFVKELTESGAFRRLFFSEFDPELYCSALLHVQNNSYYPYRKCYTLLAVVKAIQDVKMSRSPAEYRDLLSADPYSSVQSLSEPGDSVQSSFRLVLRRHYLSKALRVLLTR